MEPAKRNVHDWPSAGIFGRETTLSLPRTLPKYISTHDTEPPAGQLLRVEEDSVLAKALLQNKKKAAAAAASAAAAAGAGSSSQGGGAASSSAARAPKRSAADDASEAASKRQRTGGPKKTEAQLNAMNLADLKALCRSMGLRTSGKKSELAERVLEAYDAE